MMKKVLKTVTICLLICLVISVSINVFLVYRYQRGMSIGSRVSKTVLYDIKIGKTDFWAVKKMEPSMTGLGFSWGYLSVHEEKDGVDLQIEFPFTSGKFYPTGFWIGVSEAE